MVIIIICVCNGFLIKYKPSLINAHKILIIMAEIIDVIKLLLAPISYLFDPSKRIFIGYLLSGFLLIYIVRKYRVNSKFDDVFMFFTKKYWLTFSVYRDLQWIAFNQVFKLLILIPILASQISVAMVVFHKLTAHFGIGDVLAWPSISVLWLFTLLLFIVDDFTRFFVHFLYHKVPVLWRFHAIHHSAKTLTPLTLYRVHFVEYAINSCRSVIVIGAVSGLFMYLFVGKIGVIEVMGVSVLNVVFNSLAANLRHSHIWFGFGKYERWFISPAQHQIHHSSEMQHLDKNFGACLAIWDRLFKCWLASKNQQVKIFGLYKQKIPDKIIHQLMGLPRK
jgi:sterol desaturase/sphingolipid hydroxylase (fatty acid hydroxylase superfamily)